MTDRDRRLYYVVNSIIQVHVYRMPVNIKHLCELYGIHWLTFEEYGYEAAVAIAGNRDGAAIRSPEGRRGIIYNDKAPSTRLRFTIAEELMHHLLGHSDDLEFLFGRHIYTDEKYQMYEDEAKRAAGMILVPPSVYYRFRQLYSHDQIAKLCKVSEACVYTCAKIYDENEEEIREMFTMKHIECDKTGLVRKNPLRPKAVEGKSL